MFNEIDKFNSIPDELASTIKGGKTVSYGNGVYCNKKKCWTNWNEAWHSVGRISYGTWAKSLGKIR